MSNKKSYKKSFRSLKKSAAIQVSTGDIDETDAARGHIPVLLNETVALLNAGNGGLFIDATLGLGGHTEAILTAAESNEVIGIDQDNAALTQATAHLSRFGARFRAVHANFDEITQVWRDLNEPPVSGILADLGVSSLQLDTPERGFSFRFDAPLDMRMNQASGQTAFDLLETLGEEQLANIIFNYGEERFSRRIARRIIERRENGETPQTTRELAVLIEKTVRTKEKIHPATRTFQALRIAVNRELDVLESFIAAAIDILPPGGRFAIISFHSLEDRIVKNAFRKLNGQNIETPRLPIDFPKLVEILTRRPIQAEETEILRNPRARSAKLRVCQKLEINRTDIKL